MSWKPFFYERDWSRPCSLAGTAALRVRRVSWAARGGPEEAELEASLPEAERAGWFDALRCPVELYDERGVRTWWGYVHTVRACGGGAWLEASLDSLANRIWAVYNPARTGSSSAGARRTTAPVEDFASQALYGIKEKRLALAPASETQAAALCSTGLEQSRLPELSLIAAQASALRIFCKGWWQTLDWRYFSCGLTASLGYTSLGAARQPVMAARLAQQISTSAQSVRVLQVSLVANRVGSPADALRAALYSLDAGGQPDTLLSGGSLSGALLAASAAWVTIPLSSEVELRAGGRFALVISRTGAADTANYYEVNVNEACGYAGGALRLWNGSAWAARSPDADLVFTLGVNNQVETTTQIADIAASCGQFFTGTEILTPSAVFSPSYRSGERTALAEIQDLLDCGGPNGRRLIASVDANRRLLVREAPDSLSPRYRLGEGGQLLDALGCSLSSHDFSLAVGEDARVGLSARQANLKLPGVVQIDRLVYEPQSGEVVLSLAAGADSIKGRQVSGADVFSSVMDAERVGGLFPAAGGSGEHLLATDGSGCAPAEAFIARGGAAVTGDPADAGPAPGWKLSLNGVNIALGAAGLTLALKARNYVSLFYNNPANNASGSNTPDSSASFTVDTLYGAVRRSTATFCRVKTSGAVSIPSGSWISVPFGLERWDDPPDVNHWSAGAASNVYARIPGVYLVCASLAFAANGSGQRWAALLTNGSVLAMHTAAAVSGEACPLTLSAVWKCTDPSDAFSLMVRQTSGAPLDLLDNEAYSVELSIARIG